MKKRYFAFGLSVLMVFASFGFCFATDYTEANGVGANKISTSFTLEEEECFKVSVPASNEISWFTGSVENEIKFSEVLLGTGHTLEFGIDVGNSTYYTMANKFTLNKSDDATKKIMLDITVDDTTEFNCNTPKLFSFSGAPVESETHKIKFTIDKDYVDEDIPELTFYPITGATYEGHIAYIINIV